MDNRTIRQIINLEVTPPTMWESLVLTFCRMQTVENDAMIVHYKTFSDRLYIIKRVDKKQQTIAVPFDGGAFTPWMN